MTAAHPPLKGHQFIGGVLGVRPRRERHVLVCIAAAHDFRADQQLLADRRDFRRFSIRRVPDELRRGDARPALRAARKPAGKADPGQVPIQTCHERHHRHDKQGNEHGLGGALKINCFFEPNRRGLFGRRVHVAQASTFVR